MELSIIVALAAVVVTAAALCVDALQTRSIRKINKKIEAFQPGNIGEQIGQWLLAVGKTAEGEEVSNMAALSRVVGHEISRSFSMGLKGIASGESRTVRAVEKAVIEGIQTPETKALMDFCDRIGLDRNLAGTVYDVLEKRGMLPQILKNNGQGASSNGWQI